MFGAEASESPRSPSPWDPFLSSPPPESTSLTILNHPRNGIPRLVPEIEEGNVEYKLKLTEISRARFDRLVTQLKWRLLEGGGQAYYELGVADSGALIGLSRCDLEQSLETLEEMAGEIGASVIVVKEIEVPPAMVALADKISAYIDPQTGQWTEKMSNRRHKIPYANVDSDYPESATETEADTTDVDDGVSLASTPNEFLEPKVASLLPYAHRFITTNPNRPMSQSSPDIFPIDNDLALFSMEPEPSLDDETATPAAADTSVETIGDVPDFSLDIEISSVFKPRPARLRVHRASVRPMRRTNKVRDKGKQPRSWKDTTFSGVAVEVADTAGMSNKRNAKALQKRMTRDRRREERSKTVAADMEVATVGVELSSSNEKACDAVKLASRLHVPIQSADTHEEQVHGECCESSLGTLSEALSLDDDRVINTLADCKEPRLIVEALVVRKMSADEGYINFTGLL